MLLTTKGIVIKEQTIGEHDKLVTILTEDNGVIRAFVTKAKNIKNKFLSVTELFAFSRLQIYSGREKYIINNGEVIDLFFDIRNDLEKLALAQFFCEVVFVINPDNIQSSSILRLLLNCLSFLSKGSKGPELIKAIFELRILTISGFMPDLIMCKKCNSYNSEIMHFSIDSSNILCNNCFTSEPDCSYAPLSAGVFSAMRHIIYSDFNKLFSFDLSDTAIKNLSKISEDYFKSKIDYKFKTLDFYHSLINL